MKMYATIKTGNSTSKRTLTGNDEMVAWVQNKRVRISVVMREDGTYSVTAYCVDEKYNAVGLGTPLANGKF